MDIVGIGLILLSLSVAFCGVCFVKGLKHIVVDTVTININGMPSVSVPSVFGDAQDRPESIPTTNISEDVSPVVVPLEKFDDSKIESSLKVKETKAKGGVSEAAAALKRTIKEKEKV